MDQSAERKLLRPIEVRRLFGVGRTTIHDWTEAGVLSAELTAGGHRRYPASQQAIRARLDALEASQ